MKNRSSQVLLILTVLLIPALLSQVSLKIPGWVIERFFFALLALLVALVFAAIYFNHKANSNTGSRPGIAPLLEAKNSLHVKLAAINLDIQELSETRRQLRTSRFIATKLPVRLHLWWRLMQLTRQDQALREALAQTTARLDGFASEPALEIQQLLVLAGWSLDPGEMESLGQNKVEFEVQQKHESFEPKRVLVHYSRAEASSSDVEELGKAMTGRDFDEGWLIAQKFFDQAPCLQGSASSSDPTIRLFTPDELCFKQLLNLEPYFDWLRKAYESSQAARLNVEMIGDLPEFNSEGKEVKCPRESVEQYINDWLGREGRNNIALLGNFGTGKSWFCLQFAGKQMIEYAKRSWRERIPILISLKDRNDLEPEVLIRSFFKEQNIRFKDFPLFEELNRKGRFLIILDGLDEAHGHADEVELTNTLTKLLKLAVPKGKIILTSRRTLFKSGSERENLLGLRNHFKVIRLKGFDDAQIKRFLRNRFPRDWKTHWDQITSSGAKNLLNLAKTPVMLEIILQVFKEGFSPGKQLTVVDLYKKYTDLWLEKVSRNDGKLDDANRRRLMHVVAWKMFEDKRSELHHSELQPLINAATAQVRDWRDYEERERSELLSVITDLAATEETAEETPFDSNVLNRSFLVRDSLGNYFFAHRSFLEYFVARKLCRDLKEGIKESFAIRTLSPEIIDFLRCMEFDPLVIFPWIGESRGQKSPLHGNLLTILNKKNVDLRDQDFSGLHLQDADLEGANLEGCSFAGSTLNSVNVRDCRLNETDFTGTLFDNLILGVRSSAKGVAFSHDGKHIASGRDDHALVVFAQNGKQWKLKEAFTGHQDSITNVTFTRDRRLVASSSFDRTVMLWKLNSEKRCRLPEHEKTVYDLEFSASGNYLFTASARTIKVWRIKETLREILAEEITTLTEHDADVYKLAIKGEYLASACFDNTVGIWKIKEEDDDINVEIEKRLKHQDRVNGIAFSPAADLIVSAGNDKTVIVWSLADGTKLKSFKHSAIVWDVAFSHSGREVAIASLDKTVRVWDVRSDHLVTLEGHTKNVWSVCFSHDDTLLVSGSLDNTVRVWDWKTGKCVTSLPMGDSANGAFECNGMKLQGAKGLSDFQEMFLRDFGATS